MAVVVVATWSGETSVPFCGGERKLGERAVGTAVKSAPVDKMEVGGVRYDVAGRKKAGTQRIYRVGVDL